MSLACARCGSEIEADDLRCPVCAFATPGGGPRPNQDVVTVLRCGSCGAAVAYDVARHAPHCAFCGSTMQVERTADPLQQAEYALPFLVDGAAASAALDAFLAKGGFFHPSDLAARSGVASVQPIFWAGWAFDAQADVAYATDSDAGHGRSRWAPHAGIVRMGFERVVVSASRGLTDEETRALVPGYALDSARPVAELPALGPREAHAERFELQRSAARRMLAGVIERLAVDRVTRGIAPGSRFRNTRVSLVLRGLNTHRLLFPAWILTYRYDDEPYRVVVHGQRADVVLGRRPLSLARVLLVAAGIAAVALSVVALVALLAR